MVLEKVDKLYILFNFTLKHIDPSPPPPQPPPPEWGQQNVISQSCKVNKNQKKWSHCIPIRWLHWEYLPCQSVITWFLFLTGQI
jgi:hypothetical protein